MDYIFCSVIWGDIKDAPGFTATGIAAARLNENGKVLENRRFVISNYKDSSMAQDFINWCGNGFMLCCWDGYTAGKLKKYLTYSGIRHPYEHMYHLSRVFELSSNQEKDISKRRIIQSKLSHKPTTHGRIVGAENEVKWMCGIFSVLDFSLVEKKPSVDFIEQPSNKYFVFKSGKCFHTKDCKIVRDAVPASVRAYTYYSSVVDAGFSPCSKCKPVDLDKTTNVEMKRINEERLREIQATYPEDGKPKPVKRKKKPNLYRSLRHMCAMYQLGYEKKADTVYITTDTDKWCFMPEAEKLLLCKYVKGGYKPMKDKFDDAFSVIRHIAALTKNNK